MIILLLIPLLIGIPLGIVRYMVEPAEASRTSRRRPRRSGRRSKGFIGSLMSEKTGGKMCGPGGHSTRGKRKR